jgi:hypothetical protein
MEVNVYLIKAKENKKGKAPLRITVGSYIKIPLGITVTVKNWNVKKQRVSTAEDFYFKINDKIEKKIKAVAAYVAEVDKPDPKEVERIVKEAGEEKVTKEEEPKEIGFFEYFDSFIERQKVIKSSGYGRNLKAVRTELFEYNPKLKFSQIDKSFMEGFVKHLIVKDKENVTIEGYVKRLKLVLKGRNRIGNQDKQKLQRFYFQIREIQARAPNLGGGRKD